MVVNVSLEEVLPCLPESIVGVIASEEWKDGQRVLTTLGDFAHWIGHRSLSHYPNVDGLAIFKTRKYFHSCTMEPDFSRTDLARIENYWDELATRVGSSRLALAEWVFNANPLSRRALVSVMNALQADCYAMYADRQQRVLIVPKPGQAEGIQIICNYTFGAVYPPDAQKLLRAEGILP